MGSLHVLVNEENWISWGCQKFTCQKIKFIYSVLICASQVANAGDVRLELDI